MMDDDEQWFFEGKVLLFAPMLEEALATGTTEVHAHIDGGRERDCVVSALKVLFAGRAGERPCGGVRLGELL